jgi:hypothetical protein
MHCTIVEHLLVPRLRVRIHNGPAHSLPSSFMALAWLVLELCSLFTKLRSLLDTVP